MKLPQSSNDAVVKATGKTWRQWFQILKKSKADQWTHKEIALRLQKQHNVPGWWAQNITVEFERAIGRREVGQTEEGNYQITSTMTISGSLDSVFNVWKEFVKDAHEFNDRIFVTTPRVSKSKNWRYWRVELEDGSKVIVTVGIKSENKSLLAIGQEKIENSQTAENWKKFWKKFLEKIITVE